MVPDGVLEVPWTALWATYRKEAPEKAFLATLGHPRSAQMPPKIGSQAAKRGPRLAQERPRPCQDGQEGGQERPQTTKNVTKRRFVHIRGA